jgi:hypothetical protein
LRSLYAGTARNRCDSCGTETEGATAPQRPAPSDTERPHHRHRASASARAPTRRVANPPRSPRLGTDRALLPPRFSRANAATRRARSLRRESSWPFTRIACRDVDSGNLPRFREPATRERERERERRSHAALPPLSRLFSYASLYRIRYRDYIFVRACMCVCVCVCARAWCVRFDLKVQTQTRKSERETRARERVATIRSRVCACAHVCNRTYVISCCSMRFEAC